MIHHNRLNRRYARHKAICRKKYISNHVFGFDWYKFDGMYSKGKIHCGCKLCAYSKQFDLPRLKDKIENDRFNEQMRELEYIG